MSVKENVGLAAYSTMRLGGPAHYLAEIASEQELPELVEWAKSKKLPIVVVGGGSNIVWRDEGFDGLVLVNRIEGREVIEKNAEGATIKLGAGEDWDDVAGWAIDQGWGGIETLSLIPGTVGGTPVQNVEAYGQQIADTLQEVEVFDTETGAFGSILKADCAFGYRTSRFKNADHGRFIICRVVLKLHHKHLQPPFHRGLQAYIDEHHVTDLSPPNLRRAVIAIRSAKLPDPAKVANNGSFFKNPIVEQAKLDELLKDFPNILNYPATDNKAKLSAQWLIEQSGFAAGYHDAETGMGLWPKHALVFINEHAKNTADLLAFRQKIIDKVQAKFGVILEQEPELLP